MINLTALCHRIAEIEERVGSSIYKLPLYTGDVWTHKTHNMLLDLMDVTSYSCQDLKTIKLGLVDIQKLDSETANFISLCQSLLFSSMMSGHLGDIPVCSCQVEWFEGSDSGRAYIRRAGVNDEWWNKASSKN